MPDFGIKTGLSEFGKAVEGKRFKHPETGNQVLYTSLPMDEQHRIYEQWKKYKAKLKNSPAEGQKVEDLKDLSKGDYLTVVGPQKTLTIQVVGTEDGEAHALRVDPKTGTPAKGKAFRVTQEALSAFEFRKIPKPSKPVKPESRERKPFKRSKDWSPVDMEDLYANDFIVYKHPKDGTDRMGIVTEVPKDKKKVWVKQVDPFTGKSKGTSEFALSPEKLKDQEAVLVDQEDAPKPSKGNKYWKTLSPEEKKKKEEERKRKEEARKKAVEKMSQTGKPAKSVQDFKLGDAFAYHHDGEIYHSRIIDHRPKAGEMFTITIDPKTGKVIESGFESWRNYDLKSSDVHKLDEEHTPPDPQEANEKELYDSLPKLEEDPEKYFKGDYTLVPLSKINTSKVRLKGVLNANSLLSQAGDKKWSKREPISLVENKDGTYTVRDGNSTFTNAKLSDWSEIPAVIKTEEEWKKYDEEQKKKKEYFPKYQKSPKITDLPPPKKKPKGFKGKDGKKVTTVGELKEGKTFGYKFNDRWFVGRVDRVDSKGELLVDALHPQNGELTTLKYIRFNDKDLKNTGAFHLSDYTFPDAPKKVKTKPPSDDDDFGGFGGVPLLFASVRVAASLHEAYRPRWQDTPGYKTVVDQDSQLGIFPSQTESTNPSRGQDNLDSSWPVQAPQSRTKERALPLPSNHNKNREKRIGPTNYNKPRKVPDRTLSVPGEEYGHPTKYDYNYVTRRQDVTAFDDEDDFGDFLLHALMDEDIYEEDPVDDQLEVQGASGKIFPSKRQKSQTGYARVKSRTDYLRNPDKKREMRQKYRLRDKRDPRKKLKKKYRRMYPKRYERRGVGYSSPAQRTRDWRREKKMEKRRKGLSRRAGLEMLAEAMEILGLDVAAGNWPSNWNTQTKKTAPPSQLDQNYGKGRSRDTGTPRKDNEVQKGESLRAPDLSNKKQPGLKWEIKPPAPGGSDYPLVTTNNPTDGSGKVIPMSWYTDMVNNTQAVPDSRQDRYLRNNNFDVKVAMTVGDILKRCDKKIKERSKEYTPKLAKTDTKNWIWHWKVGDYNVRVQAFKKGASKKFPKLNLKVSCNCPFWKWWGPAHWAEKADYQKGRTPGTAQYPKVRDPAHWRPVCKHAYAVLEQSEDFFVRPGKSPLKKLGSQFSVDSPEAIEVELVENSDMAARVAQEHAIRKMARQVAKAYLERRYLDSEEDG